MHPYTLFMETLLLLTLVCVLFRPTIPTYPFNFLVGFYTCDKIKPEIAPDAPESRYVWLPFTATFDTPAFGQ